MSLTSYHCSTPHNRWIIPLKRMDVKLSDGKFAARRRVLRLLARTGAAGPVALLLIGYVALPIARASVVAFFESANSE